MDQETKGLGRTTYNGPGPKDGGRTESKAALRPVASGLSWVPDAAYSQAHISRSTHAPACDRRRHLPACHRRAYGAGAGSEPHEQDGRHRVDARDPLDE